MPAGLVLAALITTVFCLAVWGSLLRTLPPPLPGSVLLAAFLVALPLQPAAFYLVRLPCNEWLTAWLGHKPSLWIMIFYAPVTEELAKLLPLLVPAVRRAVRPESAARLALAIGLGFGIGELWFIAWNLREVPAVAALPFSMLGGFLGERFMVCLLHSAFTSLALRWRGGLLLAMLAHLGLNLPIALAAVDFPPLGKALWGVILGLWTAVYFLRPQPGAEDQEAAWRSTSPRAVMSARLAMPPTEGDKMEPALAAAAPRSSAPARLRPSLSSDRPRAVSRTAVSPARIGWAVRSSVPWARWRVQSGFR